MEAPLLTQALAPSTLTLVVAMVPALTVALPSVSVKESEPALAEEPAAVLVAASEPAQVKEAAAAHQSSKCLQHQVAKEEAVPEAQR